MSAIEAVDEPSAASSEESPSEAVLEFMRLLWAVDHQLQSTSKRMEGAMGVTGPQRLVVRLIGRYPGITAGRLAQVMHLHPSTLTGILKRLVKRGLITRQSDPLDARKAPFVLTEAGRAHATPSSGTVEAAVERVLARMSSSRLAGAQDVLTALAEELGVSNNTLVDPTGPTLRQPRRLRSAVGGLGFQPARPPLP